MIGKLLVSSVAKFPNPVFFFLSIFWGEQVHDPEWGVCLFECVTVLTLRVSRWFGQKVGDLESERDSELIRALTETGSL